MSNAATKRAVRWTSDRPTESELGWYWIRQRSTPESAPMKPRCVLVFKFGPRIRVADGTSCRLMGNMSELTEWLGPIHPEEASE